MSIKEVPFKITLKNDYAFKRVFGSEENKAVLQDFLECVLEIPSEVIAEIKLLNKELIKDILDEKTGILDVKLSLKDKTVIDIEIQSSWNTAFIPRVLFYWSKMYSENFKEGQAYTSLNKCITINLIADGYTLDEAVHGKYVLLEEQSHKKLTELMEIHFLNLSCAGKQTIDISEGSKRERLIKWLRFIDTDSKEERAVLAESSKAMQIANETVEIMSLSPVERQLYSSRMKLKSDIITISENRFTAGMQFGLAEGKSLGLAEGAHQKAVETAKKLLELGVSVENISKATGLALNEIEIL